MEEDEECQRLCESVGRNALNAERSEKEFYEPESSFRSHFKSRSRKQQVTAINGPLHVKMKFMMRTKHFEMIVIHFSSEVWSALDE